MNLLSNKLQSTITLRYIIALSLIAILATVAYFTLRSAIASTESTGFIVNISGKQRMLSQHIALDIHRIHNSIIENQQNNDLLKNTLDKNAKEMLQANKALSSGIFSNKKTISLSEEIHQMYFGNMQLSSRVEQYVTTALTILNTDEHDELDKILRFIDAHSEVLLLDLDKVVNQYEKEGAEQLENMHKLETLVWILTLFTLLLEVIFIFQPMVRKILLLNLSQEKILSELEMKIELRTAHLEKANTQLKHLASHDPLTGLQNRLKLENSIERAIELHQTNALSYGVLMLDIDWFKKVNDTYGHDVGDKVLIDIAKMIQVSLREDDKVFRSGGEEFVVLLQNISLEDTKKLVEKIRVLIQDHTFHINHQTFSKTISAGLYHSSIVELKTVHDVLKLIDIALYDAKNNGRNRISIVSEDMVNTLVQH